MYVCMYVIICVNTVCRTQERERESLERERDVWEEEAKSARHPDPTFQPQKRDKKNFLQLMLRREREIATNQNKKQRQEKKEERTQEHPPEQIY